MFWDLVFCGVKSKILAYYRLGWKEPTSSLTLYALGNFISEHRIPIMIITDIDGVLGAGKKWKHYLGRMFVPLLLSEPDKHNKNPVERAMRKLKAGLSKIRNACGTGYLHTIARRWFNYAILMINLTRQALVTGCILKHFGGKLQTFQRLGLLWEPV